MEILSRNGVQYRTKCMEWEAANRFAKCLKANSRFTGVMVYESTRAKSEKKWYVVFHPSNGERLVEMHEGQQDKRRAQALAEGDDYLFVQDQGFWWVFNPHSGNTYEVSEYNCSCPDHFYRGKAAGIDCKHMVAFQEGMGKRMQWGD